MRDQRGGSNSISLLVLLPVVLLLIFGGMQITVNQHGKQTALGAAQAGAEAQRVAVAPAGAGDAAARRVAAQGGLDDVQVTVITTATTVTVIVTGKAPVLFDVGTVGRVRASITVPKERVS